jgi:hypothetical protein
MSGGMNWARAKTRGPSERWDGKNAPPHDPLDRRARATLKAWLPTQGIAEKALASPRIPRLRALKSIEQVRREHPGARELGVYDGQRRLGTVIADDTNWRRARSWAFDAADRPLGVFRKRREAMAAVPAAQRPQLGSGHGARA